MLSAHARIAIVAGHSIKAPGAAYGAHTEHDLCRRIVDMATPMIRERGIEVYDPRTDMEPIGYPKYLIDRITAINHERPEGAIDVHLNACGNVAQNYILALCGPGDAPGYRLARALAEETQLKTMLWPQATLPRASVDAEFGRSLGFCRQIHSGVVWEPAFLSCGRVLDLIDRDADQFVRTLALALADGCDRWAMWRRAEMTPAGDGK